MRQYARDKKERAMRASIRAAVQFVRDYPVGKTERENLLNLPPMGVAQYVQAERKPR